MEENQECWVFQGLFLVHQLCKKLAQKLWEAQYSSVLVLLEIAEMERESDWLG